MRFEQILMKQPDSLRFSLLFSVFAHNQFSDIDKYNIDIKKRELPNASNHAIIRPEMIKYNREGAL